MHKQKKKRSLSFFSLFQLLRGGILIFFVSAVCCFSISNSYAFEINQDSLVSQKNLLIKTQQKKQILNLNHEKFDGSYSYLKNPTIAYLLLIFGFYGIFIEILSPGLLLPGILGLLGFIIAVFELNSLPINLPGFAFFMLGIIFMMIEAFFLHFFIIGIIGLITFVLASFYLLDTSVFDLKIARSAIFLMALLNAVFLILFSKMESKIKKRNPYHGLSALLGATGRSLDIINPSGQAIIRGEIWHVHARKPIDPNKEIRVISAKGLLLEIEELKDIAPPT